MFPFFSYYNIHISFSFLFLLLISRPCFPARTTPVPITTLTVNTHNATWHNFVKFLDAGRGSHVSGMSELKTYFHRFGYLPVLDTNLTDMFDTTLESAVISYQTSFGLPVTGKLDSDTVLTIMSPRCGVSDSSHGGSMFQTTRRFEYFSGKPRWSRGSPATLTYAFSRNNTIDDQLSLFDVQQVFKRSFSRWASVIPLNFIETDQYESADIRIGFYRGDHGDGQPFDGVLGVLAHAFSPENGRFHLDAAETWAVDLKSDRSTVAVDLESVATHEIGHVLGLAHSTVKEAVMYPRLSPRTRKVELRIDDVEGVQALYGSNPNFKFSALLESENSSNGVIGLERKSAEWTTSLALVVLMLLGLCL